MDARCGCDMLHRTGSCQQVRDVVVTHYTELECVVTQNWNMSTGRGGCDMLCRRECVSRCGVWL